MGEVNVENFWTNKEEVKGTGQNAVVVAMMDVSGSMGDYEKHFARSFLGAMTKFLCTCYKKVEVVFLTHHIEAKEVGENEFFASGESRGTRCSSVYALALDIVQTRYNPSKYNIYAFHFSDGDNLPSDNQKCQELLGELIAICNLVGYGEISNTYYRSGKLMDFFKPFVNSKNFIPMTIRDTNDTHRILKRLFSE